MRQRRAARPRPACGSDPLPLLFPLLSSTRGPKWAPSAATGTTDLPLTLQARPAPLAVWRTSTSTSSSPASHSSAGRAACALAGFGRPRSVTWRVVLAARALVATLVAEQVLGCSSDQLWWESADGAWTSVAGGAGASREGRCLVFAELCGFRRTLAGACRLDGRIFGL